MQSEFIEKRTFLDFFITQNQVTKTNCRGVEMPSSENHDSYLVRVQRDRHGDQGESSHS